MPKMMKRKDIEYRIKMKERELESLKGKTDDSVYYEVARANLTGYITALKDVLG